MSFTTELISSDSADLTVTVTAWDEETQNVQIHCASWDAQTRGYTDGPFRSPVTWFNDYTETKRVPRPMTADTLYFMQCQLLAREPGQVGGWDTNLFDSTFVAQR